MKLKYLFFILFVLLVPLKSFGASISIEPRGSLPALGDTGIFDVYLNTDNETINTVDGSILLADNNILFFQNAFVAESVFSFWPNKPVFNKKSRIIFFVGGVPGGIKTAHGLLFSFSFSAKDVGVVNFIPQKTVAYLNNEKATPIVVAGNQLSFSISKTDRVEMRNDWQILVASDKIPPQPFTITLNQDSSLFGGQKFISFMTSDNETGIAYYEVKEGKLPPERAEMQYVLQDQNIKNDVIVTAYDLAGNKRKSALKTTVPANYFSLVFLILVIVVVLLLLAIAYRLILKRKNKNIK